MRRVNIQAAFVGEPSASAEGLETADSDEAVLLRVRGGEVTLVVPSATPEDRLASAASCLRGELHLENERVLTFEIQSDAEGAFFEDEPASFHRRRDAEAPGDLFRSSGAAPLIARSRADAIPVREIMSTQIVTVRPRTPLKELATMLAFHRISGVPVVDDGDRLIGVVTESDVIARGGETIGDVMTSDVLSVAEDETIGRAAALLAERKIRRLPVVRDGRVIGLVSQADIIRWLAEEGG